jgi:hypothetical protein
MRKQIGFDVISENVGGDFGKRVLLERVQQYLDAGWEVLSTFVPQSSSQVITITVTLVKYEYYDVDFPVDGVVEVKRGPGRPKKVEESVP